MSKKKQLARKKHPEKKIKEVRPRPTGRGLTSRGSDRIAALKTFWTRYKRVIVPCAVFFVLVGLFIFVYSRLVTSEPFNGFMAFTAGVTGAMLNVIGGNVTVDGIVVYSDRFAFQIVDLCTAVMPMLIFSAAVLAYPSRIREKLLGLLIGLAGIFLVNQVRLISLYYIGIYLPDIFETAHLLVWQSLMILLAIGLWLLWVYKYVRSAAE
ncbi:MAG: archaeosortase/exosortase family protein [Dehalococcoidales bacterium]|nr:archaeosortase/exosortase family protein [Dehalococcoidales bacterium]